MSNKIALRTHLKQPPYSVLCDQRAHINTYVIPSARLTHADSSDALRVVMKLEVLPFTPVHIQHQLSLPTVST